jgi:hypothetical protein
MPTVMLRILAAIAARLRLMWDCNPALESTRLMTPKRDVAYARLRKWWEKYNADAFALSVERIAHIERYFVDHEPIYVLFDGAPGKCEGHMCLIGSNGQVIPIFQGNNYLSGEDRFVDVNDDGIPEIIAVTTMGGKRSNQPNRVVTDTTCIDIIPISCDQKPLLRILFDKRDFKAPAQWTWALNLKNDESAEITLHEKSKPQPTTKFVWQRDVKRFSCQNGSPADGFLARAGNIPLELIEDFVRPVD